MRIIAVLEIIGGISGFLMITWFLVITPFQPIALILAPIVFLIYALSVFAGIALFRDRKYGRTTSIAVQFIQLPKIFSPALIFMFSFGFDVWAHYLLIPGGYTTAGLEIKLGAFNQFYIGVPNAPTGLGISIVSCVFLGLLLKYKHGAPTEVSEPPPPPPPNFAAAARSASTKY
jgi:hypothetical protein